jgi:Protein kinase domain/Domain of unknown function (DUF4384)
MEYMAPEQLAGSPTTASDVFSLGVIAYEMLTGQKPFPAQNIFQLIEMHKTGVKDPPKNLRPDLPEAAQKVIMKALELDPKQRYARARDFGEDLRKSLQEQDPHFAPTQQIHPTEKITTGRKKTSKVVLAANLILLIVAIAIAWIAFHPSTERPKPAASRTLSRKTPPLPPTVLTPKQLSLNYYVMMKKEKDGKPFQLAKEVLFERNHRVQFFFKSPKPGYLYLINEGPGGYVVLFPSTLDNNNSAYVADNQVIKIPGQDWFKFDAEEGTEKVWIVFSPKQIEDLESVKEFANAKYRGAIENPEQVRRVSLFFKNHPPDQTESKRDLENNQTVLKAKTDPLVYLLLMEHH